jgi:hypothetical protein
MPADSPAARAVQRVDVDRDLPKDEAQELKEAVCDAVLERMRRVVSGEGSFGAVVYGRKPSQALTSGFLLPRLSSDNDEEASDISIPVHGLDLRLNAGAAPGTIRIRPALSVYIRALPSADELFTPTLGLRPKARFNAAADTYIQGRLRALKDRAEFKAKNSKERMEARREELFRAWRELGVIANRGDVKEAEEDGEIRAADELDAAADEVRIPDQHSVQHEVPEKYVRLRVEAPELELPMPFDEADWTARTAAYEDALRASIERAYDDWIASAEGKMWAWRKGGTPGSSFWTKDAWNARLAVLRATDPRAADLKPGMSAKFVVNTVPDPLSPDVITARFALENHKEGKGSGDQGLFQVSLDVSIPKSALRWMNMERVKRSYHFAGFLRVPAIGVNGGVEHLGSADNEVLRTNWMPRFVLPRMRPTEIPGVPVKYEELRSEDLDVAGLTALPTAMSKWAADIEANTTLFEPGEEGSTDDENRQSTKFAGDVAAWKSEAARIARGIDLLKRSQNAFCGDRSSPLGIPYLAWLLMNRTFAANGANPGWRLFQLAFILTHVPTLASRLPGYEDFFDQSFDEGSASLLYMSTGGGKSEAFFGVLIYALFLDRLRGKRRGVTAIIHYPLRLLTLQQARRLMRLLAQAELIRHDDGLGGAPFEIGFWVGSNNTPNSTTKGANALHDAMKGIPSIDDDPTGEKEEELRRERTGYEAKNDSWNKLPSCPFCDPSGDQNRPTGLRLFPGEHQRLGIICSNADCSWNRRQSSGRKRKPLPFLLVDTDIYHRAPSVLLGTVDKLALLGNHPSTINRLAGMFGMARFVEGDDDTGLLLTPYRRDDIDKLSATARKVAPSFSGGAELFHDPIPSLIIQDELHLLEESLGTFGGIFETTLFAWFAELAKLLGDRVPSIPGVPGRHRMPHVIGATATAADAARQMEHLYQRKVGQFPHPGPRLYSSFYTDLQQFPDGSEAATARSGAITARDKEASAPWARLYASLLTNGKTHTSASIEILTAYAVGITRWTRDLCSGDPVRQDRAAREIEDNLSAGALRARHVAAVAAARAAGRCDVLASLVDLHRIMLTYVTNKKGGDQLMSALERRIFKDHTAEGRDYEIDAYDLELISGGVDIRGIQEVIKKAESKFELGSADISGVLRGIVATSAISHGVDVNALNGMSFAGMPSDIAEYIQASSRVARTHVGFSLLIPTPQNRRDRFILENHETFHRFLERMISPPAIERWADKAIARTLPSLFQTYLVGVKYQKEFCQAAEARKTGVAFADDVAVLKDMFSGGLRDTNLKACLDFLEAALGVNSDCGGAPTKWHYKKMLRHRLEAIVDDLTSGRFGGRLPEFWKVPTNGHPQPMSSLRDVDEAGEIVGASGPGRSAAGRTVSDGHIRLAMDFIRNRRLAGTRSRAVSSELDRDEGGRHG